MGKQPISVDFQEYKLPNVGSKYGVQCIAKLIQQM